MDRGEVTTVLVTLEDRTDGGLRVWSENLPGLILSGRDRARVVAAIAPAIKTLFEAARKGARVSVRPERPLHEVLPQQGARTVKVDVRQDRVVYVVEVKKAA